MKLTIVDVKDLVIAKDTEIPTRYLVKYGVNYFVGVIVKMDDGKMRVDPYGPYVSHGWRISVEDVSVFALIED